ncbi:MAG: hypothetical protein WCX17_04120 [Parcubacteria group bacterium]|jgi:hypothetical protein
MSNINYLSILKKAWSITWSNKYLWWFGFFIALTSTGNIFTYSNDNEKSTQWINQQMSDLIAAHGGLVISGILFALVICIILLVMRILSRGALIEGTAKAAKGEKGNFTQGVKNGKKYFWRIFLISFLVQLAMATIAILIATPIVFLFMTKSYVLGALLTLVGILIIIPLFILAFFLENFAFIYVVLSNISMVDAIENSYNLFRKNMGSSVVMALIFLPISIIIGLASIMLFLFLAIIFLVIGLVFFFIFGKIGAIMIVVLAAISILLLFFGVRSIYETFYQAAWVFFFHEIASPKIEEKIAETVPEEIKSAPAPDPQNC